MECVTSFWCITLEWQVWPGRRSKYNTCHLLNHTWSLSLSLSLSIYLSIFFSFHIMGISRLFYSFNRFNYHLKPLHPYSSIYYDFNLFCFPCFGTFSFVRIFQYFLKKLSQEKCQNSRTLELKTYGRVTLKCRLRLV